MLSDATKTPPCSAKEALPVCKCVIEELVKSCYDADVQACADKAAEDGNGYCSCQNDFMACVQIYEVPFDPPKCEKHGATDPTACMSPMDFEAHCCENPTDGVCVLRKSKVTVKSKAKPGGIT